MCDYQKRIVATSKWKGELPWERALGGRLGAGNVLFLDLHAGHTGFYFTIVYYALQLVLYNCNI